MECQQSLVVEAWKRCFQRRQGLGQESKRGVPIWLSQHLPAEPFHLTRVQICIDRRRLTRCAAQFHLPGMQDDQEHRRRSPSLSRFPGRHQ